MKSISLILINMLLISFFSQGQNNRIYKDHSGIFQIFTKPDSLKIKADTSLTGYFNSKQKSILSDSFKFKADTPLARLFDSERMRKFPGKINPNDGRNELKGDIIILNPRPFPDPMPNAHVVTPGVHYHLKVIGLKRGLPYEGLK